MGRPSPTRRPTPTRRRAPLSPASRSGTRARGRVSLATQSRGSAAPFIRAGAGGREFREGGRSGAAGDPGPAADPAESERVRASSAAREHLCAPRLRGPRENRCSLLTLQPQVSAPRALPEPPAATASCEPLRQALTVKKTEQSCSHGAMAARSPTPAVVCAPDDRREPARSGRWRRRQLSGPCHRACAAGPCSAPSL